MIQYCRYCIHMICGDANYCDEYQSCKTEAQVKATNRCGWFEFCEIDALGENPEPYRPRGEKPEMLAGIGMAVMLVLIVMVGGMIG